MPPGRVGCSNALSTGILFADEISTGRAQLRFLVLSHDGDLHLSLVHDRLVGRLFPFSQFLFVSILHHHLLQVKPLQTHNRILRTLRHLKWRFLDSNRKPLVLLLQRHQVMTLLSLRPRHGPSLPRFLFDNVVVDSAAIRLVKLGEALSRHFRCRHHLRVVAMILVEINLVECVFMSHLPCIAIWCRVFHNILPTVRIDLFWAFSFLGIGWKIWVIGTLCTLENLLLRFVDFSVVDKLHVVGILSSSSENRRFFLEFILGKFGTVSSHTAQNYFYSIPLRLLLNKSRFKIPVTILWNPYIHNLSLVYLLLLYNRHLSWTVSGNFSKFIVVIFIWQSIYLYSSLFFSKIGAIIYILGWLLHGRRIRITEWKDSLSSFSDSCWALLLLTVDARFADDGRALQCAHVGALFAYFDFFVVVVRVDVLFILEFSSMDFISYEFFQVSIFVTIELFKVHLLFFLSTIHRGTGSLFLLQHELVALFAGQGHMDPLVVWPGRRNVLVVVISRALPAMWLTPLPSEANRILGS